MRDWLVIDDDDAGRAKGVPGSRGRAGGGKQQAAANVAMARAAQEGGLTRLRYGGRDYILRLTLTRAEGGLIAVVGIELLDEAGTALGSTGIRLVTPVQSLARMDPWGRIRVRRGLDRVLGSAAARIDSAVS
jgi:hypothetical protein